MGIGNRIKEKRIEKRFKQTELAKLVNVSSQVISNWERGYTDPSHDDVARLADALECSTDYLLGRTDKVDSDRSSEATKLTDKDEKDIAKRMRVIREDLESGGDGDGLSFMGEPLSVEAKESLLEALEHAERIATLANKKFIPKKHR